MLVSRPRLVLALAAAAFLTLPAAASACPNIEGVKGFEGTATITYMATISGEYEPPASQYLEGISDIELEQKAVGLKLDLRHEGPRPVKTFHGITTPRTFLGPTSGGAIKLEDEWRDHTFGQELATATQVDKNGGKGGKGKAATSALTLLPRGHKLASLGCSYSLQVGYTVATEASAIPDEAGDELPLPDQPVVGVLAATPPEPLTGNFRLQGTATVPVGPESEVNRPKSGFYQVIDAGFTGDFDSLMTAAEKPWTQATITWDLKPRFGHKGK
jgi:hypothetical protein